MVVEDEIRQAEARRLEAERIKLELETKEIERRLNARWWEGHKLTQYLLAIVITAALLFGWTRVYLEPILRKEAEVNKLAQERNATLNELLEAQYNRIRDEQTEVTKQRDRLKEESDSLKKERKALVTERDRLKRDRDSLEKRQRELQSIVAGLNLAVDKAAKGEGKFFSILNSGDPIQELERSHGWNMWSDNWFGLLGYYLMIEHPDVRSGKPTVVGRSFEIEEMKREYPDDWREKIEGFIVKSEGQPVLALDYSYFALLDDVQSPVGGVLYRQGGADMEFYAPLSLWSERLGALLPKE